MRRRKKTKEPSRPCRMKGWGKGASGEVDHGIREHGCRRGNQKSKRGRDDREDFEIEGGGPSLSAADGRIYTESNWRDCGSRDNGVVAGYRGDSGQYVVSGGRSYWKGDERCG